MTTWRPMLLALSALALGPSIAHAQTAPEWMRSLVKNADDPKLRPQKELRRKQMALEKELKKLRFQYFRSEHKPTRSEGLARLAAYREPWMIQPLLDVFQEEKAEDLRAAVLENLRMSRSDEADRGLMWTASGNAQEAWQLAATDALRARIAENKDAPTTGMLAVLQAAVTSQDQHLADGGARAGADLHLYEIIPFLIQAQTPPPPSVGPMGRPRNGPLAWIAIGEQKAYIADLNPVVADNAVAWDVVPGVVTSGVLLVINDAVATFNPTVVHQSLVDLSSRLSGAPTSGLGMRFSNWQNWYNQSGHDLIAKAADHRAAEHGSPKDPAAAKADPATPTPAPAPAAAPAPAPAPR